MLDNSQRIVAIDLDEATILRAEPEVEHERNVAIHDLLESNCFAPASTICAPDNGPYRLQLGLERQGLALDLADEAGEGCGRLSLDLDPFSPIIRDYFMLCESYYDAIRGGKSPAQIEAIDMGRRGLHDEGSELLLDQLRDRVETDIDTARRLFTLLCVLHVTGRRR